MKLEIYIKYNQGTKQKEFGYTDIHGICRGMVYNLILNLSYKEYKTNKPYKIFQTILAIIMSDEFIKNSRFIHRNKDLENECLNANDKVYTFFNLKLRDLRVNYCYYIGGKFDNYSSNFFSSNHDNDHAIFLAVLEEELIFFDPNMGVTVVSYINSDRKEEINKIYKLAYEKIYENLFKKPMNKVMAGRSQGPYQLLHE